MRFRGSLFQIFEMTDPIQLIIISGVAPGPTGVGAVMSHLVSQAKRLREDGIADVDFVLGSGGLPLRRYFREGRVLDALKHLFSAFMGEARIRTYRFARPSLRTSYVVIHPQSLGFDWCIRFFKRATRPVWLYLMDASFFCIRSYNFIPGHTKPCLACLGGSFENSRLNNCRPFPRVSDSAGRFVKLLKELVENGQVCLIAQTESQRELAYRHFGPRAIIELAGLWGVDWIPPDNRTFTQKETPLYGYDIVYHGLDVEAKGVTWALELAKALPEYSFLFPFRRNSSKNNAPPNCRFKEMSWESGLREAITADAVTIVPSQWSAPIEGAVIKSLLYSSVTAVCVHPTMYVSELSDHLVLKLNADVTEAAAQLRAILRENKCHTKRGATQQFFKHFKDKNSDLLGNIIDITSNNHRADP